MADEAVKQWHIGDVAEKAPNGGFTPLQWKDLWEREIGDFWVYMGEGKFVSSLDDVAWSVNDR